MDSKERYEVLKVNDDGTTLVKDLETNKYGFLGQEPIIPCMFDDIGDFDNGIAKTQLNGIASFVTENGDIYMTLKTNDDGTTLVKNPKTNELGLIDSNNQLTILSNYTDNLDHFHEGVATVKKGRKQGFIAPNGAAYIPLSSYPDGSTLIQNKETREISFLDANGKIIDLPFDIIKSILLTVNVDEVRKCSLFSHCEGVSKIQTDEKESFATKTGDVYMTLKTYADGTKLVTNPETNKLGLIFSDNQLAILPDNIDLEEVYEQSTGKTL